MYGEIVFYTHGSTIEYGGEIFAAGELTADILNFAPEDYRPIQRLLNRMKELARQYEDTLERGVWWELNNQLIELRSQLMRIIPVLIYDIFHIVPCSLRPPLHRGCFTLPGEAAAVDSNAPSPSGLAGWCRGYSRSTSYRVYQCSWCFLP